MTHGFSSCGCIIRKELCQIKRFDSENQVMASLGELVCRHTFRDGAQPSTIRHRTMEKRGRIEHPRKTGAAEAELYLAHRRLVFALDNSVEICISTNMPPSPISHPQPQNNFHQNPGFCKPEARTALTLPNGDRRDCMAEASSPRLLLSSQGCGRSTKLGNPLLLPSGQYGISTCWACGCEQNCTCWKGPQVKECRQLLEAGKGK
ncbi:hypothetical protein mRhiFer1_008313 [Rhinolophus ferrumequinum]|uniref:Uncharacterized protein n=1 Tax=Rhinolophus ferrumequinum TaxID=59479 RepID=A0A7J7VR23_RHIFE|nr:hypothetical protein mRhiFer1_008313 [Rhinolophus ferrumequinum]